MIATQELHRNGEVYWIEAGIFQQWVRGNNLLSTDLIRNSDGKLYRADAFAGMQPFVKPADSFVNELVRGALIVGGIGFGFCLLSEAIRAFTTNTRQSICNWEREYVRERYGFRCIYCGKCVKRGSSHIDHSKSVRNGGTKHLNNLVLSCTRCNLSKGALNAREFRRLLA